jgi:hypothetical protein
MGLKTTAAVTPSKSRTSDVAVSFFANINKVRITSVCKPSLIFSSSPQDLLTTGLCVLIVKRVGPRKEKPECAITARMLTTDCVITISPSTRPKGDDRTTYKFNPPNRKRTLYPDRKLPCRRPLGSGVREQTHCKLSHVLVHKRIDTDSPIVIRI